MISRLKVPETLQRNSPQVVAAGYEHTGQLLTDLATRSVGLSDLKNVDILDVGCGVRFTATIINRKIPVKSYTGVDVYKRIVEFLQKNVEAHDDRFRFVYWNVYNQMFNPAGVDLSTQEKLPLDGSFDLIWAFSVFTHQNPKDSLALLQLLRKHIRKNGNLFFSVFIDDGLDRFEDRVKDKPLFNAYYGRQFMRSLVEQAGWRIKFLHDKDPGNYIQHYFVCSPDSPGVELAPLDRAL